MERQVIITADGSSTIYLPEWDEPYHSKHGAIQEAYHVFIKHGLNYLCEQDYNQISILEIGFGTGLNAFITNIESEKLNISIDYYGIEAYPVSVEDIAKMNYVTELKAENKASFFENMHQVSWEETHKITLHFSLTKQNKFFSDIEDQNKFNIIYFDAFGARVQPELWTETIFQKMYEALKPNGVLVTYSAKGSVRRAMQAVGFNVEKLPGPPGKREMLRATKRL
ncbi:tRNA (5-methylaminomethyl-2-thiouridine)(34)-methyltransferase MnmD [Confluentibacter flavum]|uniref:SAM-dependent methyltransferase n=1 Tax=Confluentibacter flavum TaxID=1909700 RepID=A0A2N3HMQ0_9FLAO|nr:tRNA (5-methylaminomethyl-2-thiouridine)(34)-methyltransferase MnmD [Confluentibacter flavum]PKQ46226.1 SAM-dependent methyltransferase [Confluentibacter flavum]